MSNKVVDIVAGLPPWMQIVAVVFGMFIGTLWVLDKYWYHMDRRKKNGAPLKVEVAGMHDLRRSMDQLQVAMSVHGSESRDAHGDIKETLAEIKGGLA